MKLKIGDFGASTYCFTLQLKLTLLFIRVRADEVKKSVTSEYQHFAGETFYKLMRSACQNGDPAVDRRTFVSFDIEITGGAEELFNYILVNQPSSSLAQSKPTYTNLTATNDHPVIGIFSSRQTLRIKKPFIDPNSSYIRSLDQKSTQELCIGAITGPYLFCSNHPQDNIAPLSYACQ